MAGYWQPPRFEAGEPTQQAQQQEERMKSAEINVGDVLYWNDDNRWEQGHGRGHRVVVLDKTVGHWYFDKAGTPHNHGSRVHNTFGLWTNHGIVVEVQDGVGATRKEIVALRMLRGQYAICQVIFEAGVAARAKVAQEMAQEADRQERELSMRMARGRAALARLEAWGIKRGRDANHVEDMVSIRADVLEALMDALPLNWNYEE